MNKIYSTLICLFLIFPISVISGECIYTDPLWQMQKPSQQLSLLRNPSFKGMDKHCFIAFLQRFSQNAKEQNYVQTLLSFLRKYCKVTNTFDPSVLHAFLNTIKLTDTPHLSADIVTLWDTYNRPIRNKLKHLEDQGLYAEADSLYKDYHTLSLLDRYDMLKWSNTKGILGDYTGAAQLFCIASLSKGNFVTTARSRFVRLLIDASSREIQRNALEAYKECYLSKSYADTIGLSKWLSSMYARFGLLHEEDKAIFELDKNVQSKGQRLLTVAQRRFSGRLFSEAIPPALQSWKFLSTEKLRQKCAIILYQSYSHIGKNDSALIWLEKVNLTTTRSKADAVVLYQITGLSEKADSIIGMLPQSITKDTLTIRQFLFKGTIKKTRSFVSECTKTSRWSSNSLDNFLWKIRTAVYSGTLLDVALYLDSISAISFLPSWNYASEILTCRMAVQRLLLYPAAFKYWGQLRYATYINKPRDPVKDFRGEYWPPIIREHLLITLVDALIQNEFYDTAQYVLDLVPELDESPQINYFRALVSFMLGYTDKAKKIFENIILANPDDVFAHKSRIYLLKLKQSQRM